MPRKLTRKNIVKKLDTVFSEYIRKKYADKLGYVKCYTCNKKAYWKGEGIQNGHFISRASRALRWSEDNCRPQCYGCNVGRYGQAYIFSQNLNKEYGYDKAAELLQQSREIVKHTDLELLEKIEYYKSLIDKL